VRPTRASGGETIGFAWIIAEPLVFAIPVLFTWRAIRDPHEHGLSLMPFLWSGYLPILLFRHLCGRMLLFVRANATFLYHRRVTIFDVFLGCALLEIGGNVTALSIVCGVLLHRRHGVPKDLPMFYLGYLYMIWCCLAAAIIIGALSERSEWVEKI
jgi:capsular polysaccharide transport system permease protein